MIGIRIAGVCQFTFELADTRDPRVTVELKSRVLVTSRSPSGASRPDVSATRTWLDEELRRLRRPRHRHQTGGRAHWLVSFMDYELGHFDYQACRLEPIENRFGTKVLPVSPE